MTYGRICAVSVMMFAGTSGAASSQSVLSGCNPATGLGANGLPCVELEPLDPSRISTVSLGADGGEQYRSLDVTSLGQTYECRKVDARGGGLRQGALLIEDCGTPLTYAELGPLEPFYGTTGAPPLPPVASLPPATPYISAPVPTPAGPPISLPAAVPAAPPAALPPVGQIAGASLSGAPTGFVPLAGLAGPLIAGALGAGGAAVAVLGGDGSSTSGTNSASSTN